VIGNDIVDLSLAKKESNWKRKGFLNKIFTEKEQFQIISSNNSEIMVWNLWSRKEAAYKIYNLQTQIRAYIPLQLECHDLVITNDSIIGKVICNKHIYYTKTYIFSEFIHSIAVLNQNDFRKIKYLNDLAHIQKQNGIPSYNDQQKNILPVSISHHGRFEKIITCY
jgi:phosphopantetheinyl transferase (holo-ACP synthase)